MKGVHVTYDAERMSGRGIVCFQVKRPGGSCDGTWEGSYRSEASARKRAAELGVARIQAFRAPLDIAKTYPR